MPLVKQTECHVGLLGEKHLRKTFHLENDTFFRRSTLRGMCRQCMMPGEAGSKDAVCHQVRSVISSKATPIGDLMAYRSCNHFKRMRVLEEFREGWASQLESELPDRSDSR